MSICVYCGTDLPVRRMCSTCAYRRREEMRSLEAEWEDTQAMIEDAAFDVDDAKPNWRGMWLPRSYLSCRDDQLVDGRRQDRRKYARENCSMGGGMEGK